jgi:ABC-type sugar transport system ATPase subunit
MAGTILSFRDVDKAFFGVHAVRRVSLTVEAGSVLGIVGENGAGKSTLMNVLGGVVRPDAGTMLLDGAAYAPRSPADATAAGIAFIHQELNLFTNLSIADNLFIDAFPRLGRLPFIDRRAVRARSRELLASLDMQQPPDTLVEKLPPGERQLVEIARALRTGARIIIFDEPTTSLTARETDRLFAVIERLRAAGRTILYISHVLGDVMRLAGAVVVMRDGAVVDAGPKDDFTVDRMITSMVGRDLTQLYPPRAARPGTECVLAVRGVSQPGIVKDITFSLNRGEVLGIFGLMGSGRSELARIVFGQDPFEEGTIAVAGAPYPRPAPAESIARSMAFVTENRREEGLLMEATVLDNMGLAALPAYLRTPLLGVVDTARLREAAGRTAAMLKITGAPIDRHPAKSLSGGNQQKAVIGKWLMTHPAVLLLDEPTRGIDVGAKYEVYSIVNDLAARGTGILYISSELEELMGMCNRILVMAGGELTGSFPRDTFDETRILRAAFREETGGA